MIRQKLFTVVMPAVYRYKGELPPECKGHLYKAHRVVTDVPSYQEKILVEGLTGVDVGLWFTVAPFNFALRYDRVGEPSSVEVPQVPEKVLTLTLESNLDGNKE